MILEHFVVPKPQDPEATLFELFRSDLISYCPFYMLPAIDLDDHPCFDTQKIDDVRSLWRLALKFETMELPVSQGSPKHSLSIGYSGPELSGGRR
jgi:hypothetical protein